MDKIIAGIVLYNPEQVRLCENIKGIANQVDRIIFVDNGSDNLEEIEKLLPRNASLICNEKNLGIATALNEILQYALDHDYDWVLTLDQDSVAAGDIVETYRQLIADKVHLGMICCEIKDRNATLQREENQPKEDGYIEQCITSASMVNVKAWQEVGGFDDVMFIDSVDFDFCILLRKEGWKIFRTYKTHILHEVGHSKVIKIFGKEYLSLNHSPFRYYYIVRNTIYQGRKHSSLFKSLLLTARAFWTVVRFESQKRQKVVRMLKGFYNGFTMPISQPKKRIKTIH